MESALSLQSFTFSPNKNILSDTACSQEHIRDYDELITLEIEDTNVSSQGHLARENYADIPICKSRRTTQGKEIRETSINNPTHLTIQTNYHKSFTMNNLDNSYPNEPASPSKYQPYRKTVLDEIEMQEDCKINRNGGWPKTKLMLIRDSLAFFECTFLIKDIEKIKILPFHNSNKYENTIKISKSDGAHMFSMSLEKRFCGLPAPFYVFARMIEKKLNLSDIFFDETWQKIEHTNLEITNDSLIYGNISKKSQVLGNWESRFIVVKKDGIYSYPDNSSPTHTFAIESKSIKYLWTRFDIFQGCLVVKIKHGFLQTEFAIPITKLSERDGKNWLYSFYRIIHASE